jgi:hypothetical protein
MNEPERIFCYVSIICMSCLGIRQAPDRCLATLFQSMIVQDIGRFTMLIIMYREVEGLFR